VPRALVAGSLALFALTTGARRASAQAWVTPAHVGEVTFVVQTIDHYGRFLDDGSKFVCCRTTNVGIDIDVDYGVTDRFSISFGIPYVLAKYHGEPYNVGVTAFLPYLAVDSCQCWHGGFQDAEFTARYNLVNVHRAFVLTPSVSVGLPSHDYDYVGEAVIGFGLKEARFGVDVGQRLDTIVFGLSMQASYSYAVVSRVLDISHNRSNGAFEADYFLARHLSVRGLSSWQVTHGGLRFPADVRGFPDRILEFHRLLRDNYLQVGGGLSYFWHEWDVSASYTTAVSGSNSHTVRVISLSAGKRFGGE
jgi:hypothetical protein